MMIPYNDGSHFADDFEEEFEPRSKKSKTRVIGDKDVIEQQKNERKNPAQRYAVSKSF